MGFKYFNYFLLLSFFIITVIFAEKHNQTKNKDYFCNINSTEQYEDEFITSTVSREYIVRFNGYYEESTRENYINAALSKVVAGGSWKILPHASLMKNYPSDFDVVFLECNIETAIEALKKHKAIRHVSSQRQIQWKLKHVQEDDCDSGECMYSGWRNHKRHSRKLHSVRKPGQNGGHSSRKLLRNVLQEITSLLKADLLWKEGITGDGVNIAIFDTGLSWQAGDFENVRSITDWTGEGTTDDMLGHGTFVAGVIGAKKGCLGFAPGANIHIFKVFTKAQVSFTSWFLDAFNYALLKKMNILNLSIGGPDFMDQPFVDKVLELSANKVIMVSAIGNDGPQYGTLNNPADQIDVIGVGGVDGQKQIAKFSSRGMTTWELPCGYGRMKPDVVTYSVGVRGLSPGGGCRSLSGTSVASPVVAGAVALLLSVLPDDLRTPATVKQALAATARRLPGYNMFEQGNGMFDLIAAHDYLRHYRPHVSLSPPYLDLTECPYMWPFCTQPLYHSGQPITANITIINGFAVSGNVVSASWHPYLPHGPVLAVSVRYSEMVWPWVGWLAVSLQVTESGAHFDGYVEGHVNITVRTYEGNQNKEVTVMLPIRARVVATPARSRRLLWDQFHSLRYPSGYFPRDDLSAKHDPLDWHADHVHTNFRDMYRHLRELGYYVEVMGTSLTCVDTSLYGALLIVDPEDEYFPEEMAALKKAVDSGLSLIVFADWYNATLLRHVKFYDENTRQWWIPETGGANVPALNDLLSMFQVALGDRVFEGNFKLAGRQVYYASGTHIHSFPKHGTLITAKLYDQGQQIITGEKQGDANKDGDRETVDVPILGLLQTHGGETDDNETNKIPKAGRLVVYGDSSCLESGTKWPCHWLMGAALQYAVGAHVPAELRGSAITGRRRDVHIIPSNIPKRPEGSRLHKYSRVLSEEGGGLRHTPSCPEVAQLESKAMQVPPSALLGAQHRYANPYTYDAAGAGAEGEGAEEVERAWRGAVAAGTGGARRYDPGRRAGGNVHVVFASRALMLAAIFLFALCANTLWRRCRRVFRRRNIIHIAN